MTNLTGALAANTALIAPYNVLACMRGQDRIATRINAATALADGWDWNRAHAGYWLTDPRTRYTLGYYSFVEDQCGRHIVWPN